MVSSRPILYLSLPGVAFILGVFWFRRRNKNRLDCETKKANDSGGDENAHLKKDVDGTKTISNGSVKMYGVSPQQTSKSININGALPNDEEHRIFGKSAPIKIVQNGRGTSPLKQSQQHIDSEVLKSKIQNAENKLLRSIDEDFENLSSPVDLPDSINITRMSFYSRNVDMKKDKPVVIIASTTPKISPENSFLESKYTKKECEQNNNFDDTKTLKNNNTINEQQIFNATNNIDTVNTEEIDKFVMTSAEDVNNSVIANQTEKTSKNINEKRNVEAASPTLSLCSIQSGDSGKGSSLPRSEVARVQTTYEFFLPNSLVGQLYGRKHSFINLIKTKTNASVALRLKIYPGQLRVCAIAGTESEIQAALVLIRQRLPVKRYPNLTMQKVHFALPLSIVPLSTESLLNLQLNLIEGINNDVLVSSIISGGHIFVQHPLHPTHPSLAVMQKYLYDSYTNTESPLLPGVELSAVCVMPVNGVWYRVQIVEQDSVEADRCIVKFLDFGGYMNVHFKELRQIRSDFMSVPFQATECILSNIEPLDTCWSAESADTLANLTKGIVLQAQVAGYNSYNIPEIYLFACIGPSNVIFINKELVARNLAIWVDIKD